MPRLPRPPTLEKRHRAKKPRAQTQVRRQATINIPRVHNFLRRPPPGYSVLYSRHSRRFLDQCHQSAANCWSFGSRSFTFSTISELTKIEAMPQTGTHTRAKTPIMNRAVVIPFQFIYRSINRSTRVARPVWSSHSTTTAHRRTSPLAGSKRAGIPLRNFSITNSFFTPMTLS